MSASRFIKKLLNFGKAGKTLSGISQIDLSNKDYAVFSNEYQQYEKEILVLTSDQSGAAAKLNDSWNTSQYFLAYVNLDSQVLIKGEGRLRWLLTDQQCKEFGIDFPFYFKKGMIYHLKVRELIDKNVLEGMLPSFFNSFMVVDVIKENVHHDDLLAVLSVYRTPVRLFDPVLGEFILNKDFDCFQGEINWNGEQVSVYLDVDKDNQQTWQQVLSVLRALTDQQARYDAEFRTFAADQLTALANEWLQEDGPELTRKEIYDRIKLSGLTVAFDGDYDASYDDDNLFGGHAIEISGNIKEGNHSANIVG